MDVLGLHFQAPWWLLGLVVGPLALWVASRRARVGAAVKFPGAERARQLRPTLRQRLRGLPALLVAVSVMLGSVAMARPQRGSVRRNVTTEGVDIVVCLDVSGSMAAEDFQPHNRLKVAKDVVAEFVRMAEKRLPPSLANCGLEDAGKICKFNALVKQELVEWSRP